MGQAVSACSSCASRCCDLRRPHQAASTHKPGTCASPAKPGEDTSEAIKQPLVVEDESWKRWSSYNLIHHPPAAQPGVQDATSYTPPTYVSATQQSAEAVWDL